MRDASMQDALTHNNRKYVDREGAEHTLGAQEDTSLLSLDNSTVDVASVCWVGDSADGVVGLDVLLDGLTAAVC